MEDKIIDYLGVTLLRNGFNEVLGKICPIYANLGVEKSKEKFVTDREMRIRRYLESNGIEFLKAFSLENAMKDYVFW